MDSIIGINKKRVILRESIKNSSSFILKQRLEILLSVIEESSEFEPNSEIRFGISSGGMDNFWEEMLLQTLGSESKLNEINEAIQPLQILNETDDQYIINDVRKHKLDGVANFDSNPLNQDVILYDAKHYTGWDKLSIEDVTKQYAYEQAIASNALITYSVRKNCFIFPMMDIENSISNVIIHNGNYRLPYLEGTDTPQLQIIELNPYLVLESYSKGVENNLDDELRKILN